MSIPRAPFAGAAAMFHPVVVERRLRDLLLLALSAIVPAALALGLTVALPNTSLLLVLGVIAASVGIMALMVSSRLEVTVVLLVLYLGLLDGPVKLLLPSREITASVQDILVVAICAGALMRLVVRRERVKLPPLSSWVIAWVTVVAMNAFNPKTEGVLHSLGGFRQQLQWVPFFFFGYVLIRSRLRFRQLFIILGVIALINGGVAAYQTGLSPSQLASWGPGYRNLVFATTPGSGSGRVYASEGEARVRPPGLGSEAGFSGSIGQVALPCCLALLAITRRRRWLAALLTLGAGAAIVVGLSRLPLIGAALSVLVFTGLAARSGQRITRTIAALLAVVILAIPAGALLVSQLRSGTLKRYERINTSSSTTLHKQSSWERVPGYAVAQPFGFGLGTAGPVSGLGGKSTNLLEGHGLSSETQWNVLVKELGIPGLILWPGLIFYVIALALGRLRRIKDADIAICLAGLLATLFVLPIEAFSGGLTASTVLGPYYWFAAGVAAYWFCGPGWARFNRRVRRDPDAGVGAAQHALA
jgi:hypothetical protein